MRTRGAMGRMVDKMTRAEKSDMMDILGRIERGVNNAAGTLHRRQTRVELEDIRIVAQQSKPASASNVTAFPTAPAAVNNEVFVVEEANSNVVHVQNHVNSKPKPIKAFPKEFYDYFEFVEENTEKRVG